MTSQPGRAAQPSAGAAAPAPTAAVHARAGVTRTVARVLLRRTVPWLSVVFLAVAVVYGAVSAGIGAFGPVERSVWASVHWMLQWAGFAAGIAVGTAVPVLVAHGVTRRRCGAAAAGLLLVLAAALGLAVSIGLWLEWAAYRAAGLPHQIEGSHLFQNAGQAHWVIAEYTLAFGGFLAAGWLVTSGYLRLGGRLGTVVLPLTFAPAALTLLALASGWRGRPAGAAALPWEGTVAPAVALGAAVAVVLAGLAAAHLLTLRLPVR